MYTEQISTKLQQPKIKKKLTALVVTVAIFILNDIFELGIETQTLTYVAGIVGTYMLGQGFADIGKERAIIQASTGMAENMEVDISVEGNQANQAGSMLRPGMGMAMNHRHPATTVRQAMEAQRQQPQVAYPQAPQPQAQPTYQPEPQSAPNPYGNTQPFTDRSFG